MYHLISITFSTLITVLKPLPVSLRKASDKRREQLFLIPFVELFCFHTWSPLLACQTLLNIFKLKDYLFGAHSAVLCLTSWALLQELLFHSPKPYSLLAYQLNTAEVICILFSLVWQIRCWWDNWNLVVMNKIVVQSLQLSYKKIRIHWGNIFTVLLMNEVQLSKWMVELISV